jgi:hypothetical protein
METVSKKPSKRERVEKNRTAADQLLELMKKEDSVNKILIDCSFGHIMNDFERTSLAVQIQQCYSHLRKHVGKTVMHAVSVDTELNQRILKQGGDEWIMDSTSQSLEELVEIFRTQNRKVIVMSPDAEEEFSASDLSSANGVFVIGGIVDRLVSRNETAHKAIKLGIESRRLPTDGHRFKNKVFNIDSVFDFLLRCFDLNVIPTRDQLVDILCSVLPERKKKGPTDTQLCDTMEAKPPKLLNMDLNRFNTIKLERYNVLELFQ